MTTLSVSENIRALLLSDGVVTPMYINKEPADPIECLTIYDTGGDPSNPKYILDYPTIQIRSRAADYDTCFQNIQECFEFLNGRPSETVNTTRFTGIMATTGLLSLGQDSNQKYLYTTNFRLFVENATSGHRLPL